MNLTERKKILKKVNGYKNQLERLISKHIAYTDKDLKPVNVKSTIVFCKNGLVIYTNINKHDPSVVLPYETNDTTQEYVHKQELPLNDVFIADSRDIRIAKVYNLKTIKDYNEKSLAEKHFKTILENNYLNDDQKIKSLKDALEHADIKDHPKGEFIFRGQIDEDWLVKPSLFRTHSKNANEIEINLFNNLMQGEQSGVQKTFDPLEHLINCQHFGVPTRLLDFTSDFLVALFFACYDEKNEAQQKDGVVYILLKQQFTNLLVNDSKYINLKNPLNPNNIKQFRERLQINDIKFIEPVVKNPRLRVQDGCFLFFPFLPLSETNKEYVDLITYTKAKNKRYQEINDEEGTQFVASIKVAHQAKKAILQELKDNYGITKESLYVDIDKVNDTERYYTLLYDQAIKDIQE